MTCARGVPLGAAHKTPSRVVSCNHILMHVRRATGRPARSGWKGCACRWGGHCALIDKADAYCCHAGVVCRGSDCIGHEWQGARHGMPGVGTPRGRGRACMPLPATHAALRPYGNCNHLPSDDGRRAPNTPALHAPRCSSVCAAARCPAPHPCAPLTPNASCLLPAAGRPHRQA